MQNLFDPKKFNWEKYWAGNWHFISAWSFGYYYAYSVKEVMGENLRKAAVVSRGRHSRCYLDHKDRERFGQFICSKVTKNNKTTEAFCLDLKNKADTLIEISENLLGKNTVSEQKFIHFTEFFQRYSGLHVSVRHIVDFLDEEKLAKYLTRLQESLLYADQVYLKTEMVFIKWAKQIANEIGLDERLILCLTSDEIARFYVTGELPDQQDLKNRSDNSLIIFKGSSYEVYTGKEAEDLEKQLSGG